MIEYKEQLVDEIKARTISEKQTDKESFFNIYSEKLESAELIEDFHYLSFEGIGVKRKKIQIDGYAYNELDSKLSLVIIPPLSYYDQDVLTQTEADKYFSRAENFFNDAEIIIANAEESSEGYGLALDIAKKNMKIRVIELIIFTDLVKSEAITVIHSIEKEATRIDYTLYDVKRIKALDETSNGKEPLTINLKNDFDFEGIPCLPASKTDEYEAYMCNIPGLLLAKMYDKHQSRLLEGNVRSFLQTKGKVNKGIRQTILNNPNMFFAYNNGIAATAEALVLEETNHGMVIKEITSLQIVNGGQTTASLANAYLNDTKLGSRESIKNIYVPMKLSVVSSENAQELIPNISRFANSQNKVSDADLASNHPFHVRIEGFSRSIAVPPVNGMQFGTYWYYERANGQYKQETYKTTPTLKKKFEMQNPRNQMFKKIDLAKHYNIYLEKPHIASAGGQKSFNTFNSWMISKWDANDNFFNEEFFKKIVALSLLFRKTDLEVKKQDWYNSYKANIVAYTLSLLFYKVKEKYSDKVIDFNKLWKNQDISEAWKLQIKSTSKLVYEHLIADYRTVENVTEWAKRQTCWDMAKDLEIEINDSFEKELADKYLVENEMKAAKKNQKVTKEINATIEVINYGVDFWKEVLNWGNAQKVFNTQDVDFLNVAIGIENGKIPTDKQSKKILDVLEKSRIESFPK